MGIFMGSGSQFTFASVFNCLTEEGVTQKYSRSDCKWEKLSFESLRHQNRLQSSVNFRPKLIIIMIITQLPKQFSEKIYFYRGNCGLLLAINTDFLSSLCPGTKP